MVPSYMCRESPVRGGAEIGRLISERQVLNDDKNSRDKGKTDSS
jgi:hypothetical protein